MRVHRAVALALLLGGCASEPVARDAQPPDDRAAEAADTAAADVADDDGAPDAAADAGVDAAPGVPQPRRCAADAACDGRLDDAGLCRGACVSREEGLTCVGTTRWGLCHAAPPLTTETYVRGGWRRAIVRAPEEAETGEDIEAVFTLTNTGDSPSPLAARVEALHGWTLLAQSPGADATQAVDPGGSVTYTVRLRAGAPTVLDRGQWAAARVAIAGLDDRGGWPVMIRVRYPAAADTVACGTRHFPARLDSPTLGAGYTQAVCCGGVFYPGAECCDATACGDGMRCLDGRCARTFPGVPWASSPLVGPQRVLVVLVDGPPVAPADACADRSDALRTALDLEGIADWFASVSRARLGRVTTTWRWTVLAGLRSADLGLSGAYTPEALHDAAEAFLRARGCLEGFDADFDRTLVYAPGVDLGPHSGRVIRVGRIAQRALDSALTAHELGHTFGASDRYLDLGGAFQWSNALMGSVSGALSTAYTDAVLRGEVGLGDGDGDGVLDLHAVSVRPDRVLAESVEVAAFARSSALRVRVRFALEEAGRRLGGLPQEATISVPGTDVRWRMTRWEVAGRSDTTWEHYLFAERDLSRTRFEEALREGALPLRIEAQAWSTRDDFARTRVALDETVRVPLTAMGAALVAPPRPTEAPNRHGCGH